MAIMLNVFDRTTRKKTAVLQNAFDIIETKELNNIYSINFSLPAIDEKVKYCLPRHYIRYGDTEELYRIKSPGEADGNTSIITYECEHVITTLCDNVMYGSFNVGGYSMRTRAVIEWLLSQQKEQNWVLYECDFDRQFEYLWEQENILNALYSIPKEFSAPYKWVFDTTVYPWRISLKAIDPTAKPEFYLRPKSNVLSSNVAADYANICTRIYPLGYGEGVNQLTIREATVNANGDVDENGERYGKEYIDAPAAYIEKYGIVEKILVDRRFEHANTLYAYAKTMLDLYREPSMSRSFGVTDLYPLTGQSWDNADVGKICRMIQDDSTAYITKIRRQWDKAGDLQIELSTKATDIASNVADLADRLRIESVYAQGATQLYQHSKDANATPDKGMTISLYFPSEMRQINKVLMKLSLKRFRSYSSTTDDAGGSERTTSDGGASRQTSSNGGAATYTSSDGGASKRTTSDGGAATYTSSDGGASGNTSTSNASISGSVTSGPSSITTTEDGGYGSDIETSDTIVTGKTAKIPITIEGVNREAGGYLPRGGRATPAIRYNTINIQYKSNGEYYYTGDSTFNLQGHFTTDSCDASGNQKYNTDMIEEDGWDPIYPGILHNDLGYNNVRSSGNKSDAEGHYHALWFNSFRHKHQFYHFHKLNLSSVGSHSHYIYLEGVGNHNHPIEAHDHTIADHTHSNIEHMHYLDCDKHRHSISKFAFNHSHGMDHTHGIRLSDFGSHSHTFSIPDHNHTVKIPAHSHTVDLPNHNHTVQIPNHNHTVDLPNHNHTVQIPAHSHNIVPGIYESGNASAFDIYVNNQKKGTVSATSFDGDITTWLLNNKNQVPRNSWIDIEIRPNDLAYVVCSVFVQGFVQSRGGGNY